MDLSSAFNAAAEGPSGDPAGAESIGPQDLSGGGAATPDFTGAAAETSNPTIHPDNPVEQFEEGEFDDEWEEIDIDRLNANIEAGRPKLTIERAEAELAQLEAERPAPVLENNFRPPRKLEQIVHTGIERERELRIAALTAYLEFARPEMGYDPAEMDEEFEEGPELAL